ncbi:MAG TPA: carboxymuconolactone decarboxylase family protein [Kosmotogaceae bacterium]|nr:MAG: Alkylhydroperoxidase AhpD family core domain protein [Thermotogales bacterium 46_20]HAA85780.1 carboxymuconolactone decarboxylase family protein [Kosmotogaceae bacterium]
MSKLEEFRSYRERMNKRINDIGSLNVKRFFALDSAVYRDGYLPRKTKEMLGLVASLVLRCDDCVSYHIVAGLESGITRDEIMECMEVALIVGGSIVIPHMRRAVELMDELFEEGTDG